MLAPRSNSFSDKIWPVAVIGAGPAGSICSLSLARSGHEVLLVDKERFPRDKACGDLLIPDSLEVLRKFGIFDRVAAKARALSTISVFSPSRITFDVRSEYLALKRFEFDHILQQSAVDQGAVFCRAHVSSVNKIDNGVSEIHIHGHDQTIKAKFVVLATGGQVDVAARVGVVTDARPSALAIRCYVKSRSGPETVVVSYDKSLLPGYGWIIPVGGDEYNVGCGVTCNRMSDGRHNLKKSLRTFLQTFPPAVELMRTGEQVSHISGASLRCGLMDPDHMVKDRVIAVGETISTTYPFTAEGIGKAMESGSIAARVLDRAVSGDGLSALKSYPKLIRQSLQPHYRGYEVAEKYLSNRLINDFIARRLSKSEFLRRLADDFIAERGQPDAVYSLKNVLRSYFK